MPAGSEESWHRDLRSPSRILLAAHAGPDRAGPTAAEPGATAPEQEGTLVGVAVAALAAEDADVLLVVTHPDVRRRGVGRALTTALCSTLAALGATRALLEVRIANAPALALYRSLGFVEVARRRSYYRDGEDAVVLARPLTAADAAAAVPGAPVEP